MAGNDHEIRNEQTLEWFSIWGLVAEKERVRLKELMGKIREEFNGPEFEPHVTLVGLTHIPTQHAIAKFQSLANKVKPMICKVVKVTKGGFFYQCVFLLIDQTQEVMTSSEQCYKHFADKIIPNNYKPHLSLMYGDLSEEEKDKVVRKAKSLDYEISTFTFEISSLALYKVDVDDKTLKKWKLMSECKLTLDN